MGARYCVCRTSSAIVDYDEETNRMVHQCVYRVSSAIVDDDEVSEQE
jgi:hypothetical protein